MKAGKLEYQWITNAYPVDDGESQEVNWLSYVERGSESDNKISKDWSSAVPGSLAPTHIVVAAIQCMKNKGYVVTKAEQLIETGFEALESKDMGKLQITTAQIYNHLNNATKNEDSEYWNYKIYSNWDEISVDCEFPKEEKLILSDNELKDKIKAGWLGKLVGGAVGTQLEGYLTENIQEIYGAVDRYLREPETYNDDITYELVFLDVFRKKGSSVTSIDIAEGWLELIMDGYSAEEIALNNLRRGIMPPESGTLNNYFSDWIGVQMRSAIHGMLAPANPKLAAMLAVKDGIVSHSNSGLIGGIFNAILVSLAYVEDDMKELLKKTINCLPKKSEYYSIALQGLDACKESDSWEEAWYKCSDIMKEYNWIHCYPNVIAEIIALWFGDNDFDKTLMIVSTIGLDSDCNAAPILNAMGIAYGSEIISDEWVKPLGTSIKTIMRRYQEIELNDLYEWTYEAIIK